MKDDKQTVTFDELEEEKKYRCCAADQHVIEVVRKEEDRMIYDICDDDFDYVGTRFRKEWNPNRYKPFDSITYDGPSLNDL